MWRSLACGLVLIATVVTIAIDRAALAAPQAPTAPPRLVETQSMGKGATSEAAVRAAIADALRRVNAQTVAASPALARRFDDALADLDRALATPAVTVAMMEADIRTASRGLVDRVKLLDERRSADGATVDVTILTAVAIFDAKSATRKTIAVVPFQSQPTYLFAGSPVAGTQVASKLADEVTRTLVQAAVLTVLDRDHVDAISKEKSFVAMYGRTPEELARFGRMLGADYLLVGTIDNAGLDVSTQTVEASGYTFSRAFAGMQTHARLIDVETGAIVWADAVTSLFNNSALGKMFEGGAPDATGTLSALVGDTATQMAAKIVETVAPIKVALVEADTVWLNRGAGRLAPGMRLQIRGRGRDVVDPDTGENLGQAERTVAVIEVVVVDPRKSQCRVIEGDPAQVIVGQLARPLAIQ